MELALENLQTELKRRARRQSQAKPEIAEAEKALREEVFPHVRGSLANLNGETIEEPKKRPRVSGTERTS